MPNPTGINQYTGTSRCKMGHPWTEYNTIREFNIDKRKWYRRCKICDYNRRRVRRRIWKGKGGGGTPMLV